MSETPAPAPGAIHTSEDEQILHRLGTPRNCFRAMGGFQNFAISFTIISILAGCLTSYYIAFQRGGPIAVDVGLADRRVLHDFVAFSMAEIASTYPTAGGLYYWSSKLGSPAWGWFTGWFNLIGLIGDHRRDRLRAGDRSPPRCSTSGSTTRTTSTTSSMSSSWRSCSAALVQRLRTCASRPAQHDLGLLAHGRRGFIVLVLIIVPDHHQSLELRLHGDDQQLGLLRRRLRQHRLLVRLRTRARSMSQYTITGFDASAHMAEETHQASRMAAVGMYHVGRRLGRSAGFSCSP